MIKKKPRNALADPTLLKSVEKDDPECIHVIVETPKGSRNKLAFDQKLGVFRLKKVLPEGMVFPHDFGFVPSTRGEDGDPVDVLILMDEPAYPGVLVACRLVGVMEGKQKEDGHSFRNDRFIAVSVKSHTHSDIHDISDLNDNFLKELEEFFEQYHALDDTVFKCLATKGGKAARKLLKSHMLKKAA